MPAALPSLLAWLAVLLLGRARPADACSCSPIHPQQAFCNADVVIRAKAVSAKEVDSGNDIYGNPIKRIQYEIKQIKMFKGPDQDIEFIYTAPSTAVCGRLLDTGGKKEYLIAGKSEGNGKMHITLCDLVSTWDSLTPTQKKSLNQRYQMGCECKVSNKAAPHMPHTREGLQPQAGVGSTVRCCSLSFMDDVVQGHSTTGRREGQPCLCVPPAGSQGQPWHWQPGLPQFPALHPHRAPQGRVSLASPSRAGGWMKQSTCFPPAPCPSGWWVTVSVTHRSRAASPSPASSPPRMSVCGQTGRWRRTTWTGGRRSTTPASRGATAHAPGTAAWPPPSKSFSTSRTPKPNERIPVASRKTCEMLDWSTLISNPGDSMKILSAAGGPGGCPPCVGPGPRSGAGSWQPRLPWASFARGRAEQGVGSSLPGPRSPSRAWLWQL
uniref:Metalloproteinase inhibitor 2 n=1 Tax=Junco hyemalis TaxID=40217 RepID=A0A8C5IPG6_JUNHY